MNLRRAALSMNQESRPQTNMVPTNGRARAAIMEEKHHIPYSVLCPNPSF